MQKKEKMNVDTITEALSKIDKTNGDLYDSLGILVQDLAEAKRGEPGQVQDLLNTVDAFKAQIKTEFDFNNETIWDEWAKAKKEDKPYDIETSSKELLSFVYDKKIEQAIYTAIELSNIYKGDFNVDPVYKDMFDYLAIIILETIDNFYGKASKQPEKENLEELMRVLIEYQRFIACLKHITIGEKNE
jgi:hypothetical protein